MDNTLCLRIDPDGTVVCLSGSGIEEVVDLRTLGQISVERAGRIRFDADTQTWGWVSVEGRISALCGSGFSTRREAVAAEVAELSKRL